MRTHQQFSGGAFHPSLPQGKATGTLTLSRSQIRFESAHGTFECSTKNLAIEKGGAGNRLFLLTNPQTPEWTLYSSGTDFLKALSTYPELQGTLRPHHHTRTFVALSIVSFILIISGIFYWLFHSRDQITHWIADQIPIEWEIKLGETIYEQMKSSQETLASEDITSSVDELTAPLIEALGPTSFRLNFHLINEAVPNAFALPGGTIVIHSGLILKAETTEEVLGVVAHEISHVTSRHSTRQLIESGGLYLLVQAIIGDIPGLIAVLADNGLLLASRSFSREHETEADTKGLDLLVKADIHPQGLVTFFEKLLEEEKKKKEELAKASEGSSFDSLNQVMDFLSTHPKTEERIRHLKTLVEEKTKEHSFPKSEFDFENFQEKIKDAVVKDQ